MEMLIDPQILVSSGGVFRKYEKERVIFHEGDTPLYYHQIISGSVSVVNVKQDGNNFIQGMFGEGQAFGMPSVIVGDPFPGTALAATDTVIIRLAREPFLAMLKAHPDELLRITEALARKLYHKALMGKGLAIQGPEERISTLLQLMKKDSGCPNDEKYRLSISRQQMADMIGLRVETVIRAVKKLEEKGVVAIEHGKVFY